MKIATYHRMLGDRVTFFKGNVFDLIVNGRLDKCIVRLNKIDRRYNWNLRSEEVSKYIRGRKNDDLESILNSLKTERLLLNARSTLRYFGHKYLPKIYDRIYVTTLFTFHWRTTITAIKQSKKLVKKKGEVKVGGVMASLLPKEIEQATGIKPVEGLLDRPSMLDSGNSIIVDELNLDYSILDEIDYQYPTGSAYFTFMTKGCTRKCKFCSVPILEPVYKNKISSIDKFRKITETHGDQRNLLLLDNNVLASPKFPEIIQEIKSLGFQKGAKYVEPNQFEIVVRGLKSGTNDIAYLNKCHRILSHFLTRRVRGAKREIVQSILERYSLLSREDYTKKNVIRAYSRLSPIFERYRNKAEMERYVDFNQGIDGRYVNEENMRLLTQINIRPLRIAFDFIGMSKQYINAVELAAKYGITDLSNYLLYNFKDTPEDLYERMRINIDLNKKYGLKIFSFPMKYIPLFGEDAKKRIYISPKWNRKYIRTIQSILNVSKGIVAPGSDFFEMAFGKNLKEFQELLYMPESFIIHRNRFQSAGITDEWRTKFYSLSGTVLLEAKAIIERNDFNNIGTKSNNPEIIDLLRYYRIDSKDVDEPDFWSANVRAKINKLLKEDPFLGLTMTCDYDNQTTLAKAV